MADQFDYESSMATDAPTSPFLKKQVVYVQDTQATSNYTGQINLDLSQLANSYQWIDFKSMIWEIPFTIALEATQNIADWTPYINSYVAGLKAGSHQIINSLSVNINNTSVVQLSNYLNHYVTYKLATTFSENDLKKWGSATSYIPDSATSFKFGGATGLNGPGFTNNSPLSSSAGATGYFGATNNEGFNQRLSEIVDLSGATGPADPWYKFTVNEATCQQNGISFFKSTATTAVFQILLQIRFKDICDLFNELPLLRGTYVTMVCNYNSSSQEFALNSFSGNNTVSISNLNVVGLSNPIMISSAATGQPNQWLQTLSTGASGQVKMRVSCNVGTVTTTLGSYSNSLIGGRTRVYAELFTMNPINESRYLSLKTKDVFYTDIYTYLYQNQIKAGDSFNFLATNGISQPVSVILIPYISKASNIGLTSVPIYQSPVASEPGTTSTIPLNQWQCQISGQNIFQDNFNFDFQQYNYELAQDGAINGGQLTGITSGLLSEKDFKFGYRYLFADVGRRLPNDDVSRSVSVLGTNLSSVDIDVLVIITYRRKLTFNLETGAILPTMA